MRSTAQQELNTESAERTFPWDLGTFTYKTPACACVYFSLDAAHTSGHGWPASTTTLLKKNSESQPWTLDGRAPPADITTHRLRVAPSMAFF